MSAQKRATGKSAPKKAVAKSAPKKKTASSKATAVRSKTATKKTDTRSQKSTSKNPTMKSFAPCKDTTPFMEVKVTIQTIYWLILALISVAFVVWIYVLQAQIHGIYDQINDINISSSQLETLPAEE